MNDKSAQSTGFCSGRLGWLILASIMFLVLPAALMANPASAWDYGLNPALLTTSNRGIFETGVSASPGFQNSYLTVGQVFQETLRINLDDLYDGLSDAGFGIGLSVGAETHAMIHLLGVGLGAYADVSTLGQIWIPKELFDVAANGFSSGVTYQGEGGVLARSFAEYGAYGSVNLKRLKVGVKLARFLPLAYSGDASTNFTVLASGDGSADATAEVSARLYSAFNIEDPETIDPAVLLSDPGIGTKFDIGFVYGSDRRKPVFGAALSNITLQPAKPAFAWDYSFSATATVNSDPLQAFIDKESSEPYTMNDPVTSFEALSVIDEEISMPLTLSAFYRFSGLRLIDIIPTASVVMDDPMRVNAGVLVEGAVFPLSILSLGMGYEDLAWQAMAGMKLNLHVMEIGVNISTSSPELIGFLRTKGVAVDLKVAIGL